MKYIVCFNSVFKVDAGNIKKIDNGMYIVNFGNFNNCIVDTQIFDTEIEAWEKLKEQCLSIYEVAMNKIFELQKGEL